MRNAPARTPIQPLTHQSHPLHTCKSPFIVKAAYLPVKLMESIYKIGSFLEILLTPIVLRKWMEVQINLGRIEPDIELYTKETHLK